MLAVAGLITLGQASVAPPVAAAPPVANDDRATVDEDGSVTIDVLANDTDPDGDTLTVIAAGQPAPAGAGSWVFQSPGTFIYTPGPDFNGIAAWGYRVSDGNGGESQARVDVTVNAINDDPVANDDDAATDEDTPVEIDVLANDTDVDGDTIRIQTVGDPSNGSWTFDGTGTFTYTPDADFNGSDSFFYSITDGQGGSDFGTVNITINPINDPPVAVDDRFVTDEDVAITIDVLLNDTDVDGDTLTVIAAGQPAPAGAGTWEFQSPGTFVFTPGPDFNGPSAWGYIVSDGNGGESQARVDVTVNAVNDEPVANDDDVTTDEDTPVEINVLANDTDADGDTLRIQTSADPSNGSWTFDGEGTFTYTPNEHFNGTDSFFYSIADGQGGSDFATVNITVNPVPDDPVVTRDFATVLQGETIRIDALANDFDPDGDALRITAAGQPSPAGAGSWDIEFPGTFIFTASPDFAGGSAWGYIATDESGASAQSRVDVTVLRRNEPPVANDDNVSTDEDTPVNIDVVGNDTDPDGDTLLVVAGSITTPANGTAVLEGDGTVTYTPDAEYSGPDSFQYEIDDGFGGNATATVNITVNAVNDAPVGVADNASVDEDGSVSIDVLANDTDQEGDALQVGSFTQPANGTVTLGAAGGLVYTPNADYNGPDSFTYIAQDSGGASSEPTAVDVTVNPVNDDPIAVEDLFSTDEDVATTFDPLANDLDIDGDPLTLTAFDNPANGTLVQGPGTEFTYTPDPNFNGVEVIGYAIDDGAGGSAIGQIVIQVDPVNDAPNAVDDSASTDEDTPVIIGVLANDSDIEGDALFLTALTPPGNGSAVIDGDTVVYSPDPDFNGTDSFRYTITDGNDSTSATVDVTVNPVNDPPVGVDDEATTPEDTPVVIDLLGNDTDVDGDSLSIFAFAAPANGQVSIDGSGNATYTPDPDFNGTDSFAYIATDGEFTTSASVTVTVTPVNDPPVGVDDEATTAEDTPVVIDLLGNDTDVDGDTLTVVANAEPLNGQVSIDDSGNATYTPDPDFNGTDSFAYIASDGEFTTSASVTVTVTPVNDPPVVDAGPDQSIEVPVLTVALAGSATDIDSDPSSFTYQWSLLNGPGNVVFGDATAAATSATFDSGGVFTLRLMVSDGEDVGFDDVVITVENPLGCTIIGTNGPDDLLGTPGDDVICGFDAADEIDGGGGNDTIFGGDGGDEIQGGLGNDTIDGGTGNDRMLGGGGNDVMSSVSGVNHFDGQGGNDRITGGGGNDTILGGGGRDNLKGQGGDDVMNGGGGGDTITGGGGNDVLRGGPGNDRLRDAAGDDQHFGEGGNDSLRDLVGTNVLDGGPGRDRCTSAAGTSAC